MYTNICILHSATTINYNACQQSWNKKNYFLISLTPSRLQANMFTPANPMAFRLSRQPWIQPKSWAASPDEDAENVVPRGKWAVAVQGWKDVTRPWLFVSTLKQSDRRRLVENPKPKSTDGCPHWFWLLSPENNAHLEVSKKIGYP